VAIATNLHIVSGKGGTGKTTVAASAAVALASRGRKVLLCEVEERQGIAQLFDVSPLSYQERRIATGLGGGEVFGLAIDPRAALMEYLAMYYRMGGAGRALDRFGVIDFATTIAPGVRDVLLTGKVYEAARRKHRNRFVYDAVVMDAPPTGRINNFLNVNSEVAGLAKVGPVRRQADSIMEMMREPSTRVHLVTILEEMPVQESLDAIAALEDDRLNVGHIIMNMVRADLLSPVTSRALESPTAPAALASTLDANGLDGSVAPQLWQAGHAHEQRQALQEQQRELVGEAGPPAAELPRVDEGVDAGRLYEFAETLVDQEVL